jgi:hypothetical protein
MKYSNGTCRRTVLLKDTDKVIKVHKIRKVVLTNFSLEKVVSLHGYDLLLVQDKYR